MKLQERQTVNLRFSCNSLTENLRPKHHANCTVNAARFQLSVPQIRQLKESSLRRLSRRHYQDLGEFKKLEALATHRSDARSQFEPAAPVAGCGVRSDSDGPTTLSRTEAGVRKYFESFNQLLRDEYSSAIYTQEDIRDLIHNVPIISAIAELQHMRLMGMTHSPGTSCCCCCCCCWGSCSSCSAVSTRYVNEKYIQWATQQ